MGIFFAPIIASIPAWATGGSLIIVGCLMARSLIKVKWHDPAHAATAFITVMIMPLTYSIAYGLLGGLMCWFYLQGSFIILEKVFGLKRPTFAPYYETVAMKAVAPEDDDGEVEEIEHHKVVEDETNGTTPAIKQSGSDGVEL